MSSPSPTTLRAAAAVAGALLLAGCGSSSGSSGGGLYGNAPAGSSSAGGSAATTSSSGSSAAAGRYGNPPARSSASSVVAGGGGVATAGSRFGTILVTSQKMTMYAFARDTKGHSNCTGSCATYWPPVPAADAPTHPVPGVTATFGAITRSDGTKQLTVDGYPMYTYAADRAAGDVNGQGVNASGGLWWVVSPNGSWDEKTG
ncbi:hypothetical protein GCM10027517_19860 [Phycicoccus ginsengisoli]